MTILKTLTVHDIGLACYKLPALQSGVDKGKPRSPRREPVKTTLANSCLGILFMLCVDLGPFATVFIMVYFPSNTLCTLAFFSVYIFGLMFLGLDNYNKGAINHTKQLFHCFCTTACICCMSCRLGDLEKNAFGMLPIKAIYLVNWWLEYAKIVLISNDVSFSFLLRWQGFTLYEGLFDLWSCRSHTLYFLDLIWFFFVITISVQYIFRELKYGTTYWVPSFGTLALIIQLNA